MQELSYVGRRVLAHLPVWAADEAAHVEAEGGPEQSIRAYSLEALHERLAEDQATPDMEGEQLVRIIDELAAQGLCEPSPDGFRMTQKGFEVLTDPTEPEGQSQNIGSAFVELHPAEVQSEGVA